MALLDSILNLIGALLWMNWRLLRVAARQRSSPVSLAATVKKAAPRPNRHWAPLLALVGLVGVRSLFYWNVGSAMNWTPSLELGVISLPFRSDYLGRMLLFSVLSLGLMVAALYAWLLLLSVVNHRVPPDDPAQRIVRLHLGWVERWPAAVKLLLPMLVTIVLWGVGSPGLVGMGILPPPVSTAHVWQEALLLGTASFLIWKVLILALCLLYLVNSYVYLGNSSFWRYVNTTGANLLSPLRRFPIRVGKLDLSPVLVIALVLWITQCTSHWFPWLFQRLPL